MLRRERNEERRNARKARKMNGNLATSVKKVVRCIGNEVAADTLAFAAGMGSAAIINSSVCGIVNGAARGYYDAAGVQLAVKKHRWSKEISVNSKALAGQKVHSARIVDNGWWFNPATCKKVTDVVATTSVVAGAVAGGAARGIVKDALNFHTEKESWDSEESWDYYSEEETTEE